jgi:hypothetical protein
METRCLSLAQVEDGSAYSTQFRNNMELGGSIRRSLTSENFVRLVITVNYDVNDGITVAVY